MKYLSTRGKTKDVLFCDAVLMGLAEDGGLLLPERVPSFSAEMLEGLVSKPYAGVAFEVMKHFVDDIDDRDLKRIIDASYISFSNKSIVPLVHKNDLYIAELFHGPTYAFKDVALQFLGNLFEYILKKNDEHTNIIGATSGDTGSAAIHGLCNKERISVTILYPHGMVSPTQELQMVTSSGKNVSTPAIQGTFDDCQNIVKSLFSDQGFKKEYKLGAINSINWARILAQIVYYFYTYVNVASTVGEKISYVVPTGNFGNIFACFYAKKMGLPIKNIVLATNSNDILSRFVNNGDCTSEKVIPTYSPSMDIQVASNLERYLYFLFDGDPNRVVDFMESIHSGTPYNLAPEHILRVQQDFLAGATSDDETLSTIKSFFSSTGYMLDPHTACGINTAYSLNLTKEKTICLATAHPAKFQDAIYKAVGMQPQIPEGISKLKGRVVHREIVPNSVDEIKKIIQSQADKI